MDNQQGLLKSKACQHSVLRTSPRKCEKCALFLKNHYFWRVLGLTARRSLVENDGLRSFQGAPDWWESARFQAVFLAQAGSGKATFSRPAHPRVTHTVGWLRRVPTYTLDGYLFSVRKRSFEKGRRSCRKRAERPLSKVR